MTPKIPRHTLKPTPFDSPTLGEDALVAYSVLLPAGYYDKRSRWKTYPLLIVLLDRDQKVNDVIELARAQAYLASDGYAQQVIMVFLEGFRDTEESAGYHFFLDQQADDFGGGDYRDMILGDLIPHMEDRYRAKIRFVDDGDL